MDIDNDLPICVQARFKSETGEDTGSPLDLPLNITKEQLTLICNALLKEEDKPFLFFVKDVEITSTLKEALDVDKLNSEEVVEIIYQQQAVFKVRAVTRCTSSIPGHAEAVISTSFSPSGNHLASGSGDTTVRFWDLHTQTPLHVCKGHTNWVLCISWSPDGSKLASACKQGRIMLWDPLSGNQIGKTMMGHKQWVTALAWEPYIRNPECRKLASSSKDGDVRIWDTVTGHTILSLTGHSKAVTCVKWGGTGLIYTSSQDRTIKVWRSEDGILCRTLEGHAHWVNTLALSTDYILRTGPFHPILDKLDYTNEKKVLQQRALERFEHTCPQGEERLVSGSDDFTLFLWLPEKEKRPLARMTGHQQLINDVKFSPDTRFIASASFDKSVKLWESTTGKFITTLRGHVQAVYMLAWSADSRLLLSSSADSTLKVWNMKTKKLELDLPGHADEVYAVDWSPDGTYVASGGKDKVLKLWQH
ncbi:notchless protein homolog 1 [Pararge aegeria]|uniref:Jg9226 protein n=2 Tax=Pararge aegeria TaxID=116150 RepID=A0A8S4S986_9NEOP|nr:notchless protein homolog 1 [Pararge aegeria]CAH2262853.1 jg9226 [Pararge aegeria aegeria]